MGVAAGTGEESAGAGSAGAAVVETGDGVATGVETGAESAGVAAGVDPEGDGVGVPAPGSASAGTADKVPASAIARAAAARTIGWNFGVFTGPPYLRLPYLPSFATMAASCADVTPWRNR